MCDAALLQDLRLGAHQIRHMQQQIAEIRRIQRAQALLVGGA